MTVTMLSALIGLGFCLALAYGVYARRRALRRNSPVHATAGANVFGIRPGELDDFRRSARDQLQSQRERWDRDYHPDAAAGLPGRVAGIPRALRVR